MKKIVTVIGARPQFIKAAPVSKAFSKYDNITEIFIHTGQHYDYELSQLFFDELEITKPHYNLDVGSSSHAAQTGEIMKKTEDILIKEKPDLVLIYGDTNSTLAGALTAAKLCIPIVHVEAGLRSFNMKMPEEINRIVADRLSSLLFAPTQTAVNNLKVEGITRGVYKTGDVMYDVTLQYTEKARQNSNILSQLNIKPKEYILATVHRAENTDDNKRLTNIFSALNQIAVDIPVIIPLHPRTKKIINKMKINDLLKNIIVIDPVGFLDMILLEHNAKLIVTDSGGIQKEAYFHRVPCVTLRDETEWVETVSAGWNELVNVTDSQNIIMALRNMANSADLKSEINEYGDGKTAIKIVNTILKFKI